MESKTKNGMEIRTEVLCSGLYEKKNRKIVIFNVAY
jgi:hypothetical protein